MSGTNAKAGGREYYLLHTEGKCISEVLPPEKVAKSG
jgi:hypothetical protein